MFCSHVTHRRCFILLCMMKSESAFLHDAPRPRITVIISAPHSIYLQFFETMSQQTVHSFRDETFTPVRDSYPITYLRISLYHSALCMPLPNITPTLPTGSLFSFNTTAYVSGADKMSRMTFLLSSTERCGCQPATGPTAGSLAYLKRISASSSCHGRSINLAVSKKRLLFQVLSPLHIPPLFLLQSRIPFKIHQDRIIGFLNRERDPPITFFTKKFKYLCHQTCSNTSVSVFLIQ